MSSDQNVLRVASRKSPLALIQVREVFELLEKTGARQPFEILTFDTAGDRDQTTPLTLQPADDFFTDTIDQAVMAGVADIGIHSAKDIPQKLPQGLKIFALTPALDETDAWVSRYSFAELPAGSSVGTSSLLRQEMIHSTRADLKCVDIRGTIQERIKLVEENKIQGIIVATCALKRLK